jgi:hypothetical protein
MSWKEKIKEFGGGDISFLSEDGEAIVFVVVGDPVLLAGKYKGKPSEKVGCPIVTEDGFTLFIAGKRLARKISKHEAVFSTSAFIATRTGEQNDIDASYSLKVLDDIDRTTRLIEAVKNVNYVVEINEAVESAMSVMNN